MHRKSKFRMCFLSGGLLLTALACSLFTGSRAESNPQSGNKTSGQDAGETYLGDYIEKDGSFFAALQIQDPVPAPPGYALISGTRLIAVEMIVGNQSSDMFDVHLDTGLQLIGGTRTIRIDPLLSPPGIRIRDTWLAPGERIKGWKLFGIDEESQPVALEHGNSLYPESQTYFLISLEPPPSGHSPLSVDTSRKNPVSSKLGEEAQEGGCSLKTLQVEDPAELNPSLPYTLPVGTRLVAVEIEVANQSDSSLILNNISLVDPEGFLYAIEFNAHDAANTFAAQYTINPGGMLQGWVAFAVPSGGQADHVRLICESLANPMEYIVLRAGLTE